MIIPHLFKKELIPRQLPKDMQRVVNTLKNVRSKEECLEKAYAIITKRFHGERIKTYTRFLDLFITNINELWKRKGFHHCTHLNYLLRTLLIKSKKFKEQDIKQKLTMLWYISPHQYLKIKIKNTWIDVDPWGETYNTKIGEHTHTKQST